MFQREWIRTATLVFAVLACLECGEGTSTGFDRNSNKHIETEKSSAEPNTTRIVGGTWAKRGAYPFQTAIFIENEFTCGGTLLDTRRHVLTAAHCLTSVNLNAEVLTLYFRTTVLDPPDDNYIERNATQVLIHKDYNDTSFDNDIGIITLAEPVQIRPVQLESVDSLNLTYVGKGATIVGWGRTRQVLYPAVSSGLASNNLRHVNLTIIDEKDCSILYHDNSLFTDGTRLCASTLFGKSMCQGDSGGPLLINGKQVGINSAAAGCADPRYPAIFLRVGPYVNWIKQNTYSSDKPV